MEQYAWLLEKLDESARRQLERHEDQRKSLEILGSAAAKVDTIHNLSAFVTKALNRVIREEAANGERELGSGPEHLREYGWVLDRLDLEARESVERHPDHDRAIEVLKMLASKIDDIRNPSALTMKELRRDAGRSEGHQPDRWESRDHRDHRDQKDQRDQRDRDQRDGHRDRDHWDRDGHHRDREHRDHRESRDSGSSYRNDSAFKSQDAVFAERTAGDFKRKAWASSLTITCKFWVDGVCKKGPQCTFMHAHQRDHYAHVIDKLDGQARTALERAERVDQGRVLELLEVVSSQGDTIRNVSAFMVKELRSGPSGGSSSSHNGPAYNAFAPRDPGADDQRKRKTCKFWAEGTCEKGPACPYMHAAQSGHLRLAPHDAESASPWGGRDRERDRDRDRDKDRDREKESRHRGVLANLDSWARSQIEKHWDQVFANEILDILASEGERIRNPSAFVTKKLAERLEPGRSRQGEGAADAATGPSKAGTESSDGHHRGSGGHSHRGRDREHDRDGRDRDGRDEREGATPRLKESPRSERESRDMRSLAHNPKYARIFDKLDSRARRALEENPGQAPDVLELALSKDRDSAGSRNLSAFVMTELRKDAAAPHPPDRGDEPGLPWDIVKEHSEILDKLDEKAFQLVETCQDRHRVIEVLQAIASRGDGVRNASAFLVKELRRDPGNHGDKPAGDWPPPPPPAAQLPEHLLPPQQNNSHAAHDAPPSQEDEDAEQQPDWDAMIQGYVFITETLDDRARAAMQSHSDKARVVEILEIIASKGDSVRNPSAFFMKHLQRDVAGASLGASAATAIGAPVAGAAEKVAPWHRHRGSEPEATPATASPASTPTVPPPPPSSRGTAELPQRDCPPPAPGPGPRKRPTPSTAYRREAAETEPEAGGDAEESAEAEAEAEAEADADADVEAEPEDLEMDEDEGEADEPSAKRRRSAVQPLGKGAEALTEWLQSLDGGAGALLQFHEALMEEFDGDLQQIAACKRLCDATAAGASVADGVDPMFWDALRDFGCRVKVGHKMLFAKGIEKL